jgi:hypothetical protein
MLLWGQRVSGQPAVSKEYQVKAAFLFNFAQFVEWPPAAFKNPDSPLSIGILGEDPFGSALEETVKGESIRNRKLIIKRSRRAEDLNGCQLVFIAKSEKTKLSDALTKLTGKGILTVSEIEGFGLRGGMFNFFIEGNKVRFEINPAAAQHEGLKISSQLLSLGRIVGAAPPTKDK